MSVMLGLGVASTALRGLFVTDVRSAWAEEVILQIVIRADASVRKSEPYRIMFEPIVAWERREFARLKDEIDEARVEHDRLAARLKSAITSTKSTKYEVENARIALRDHKVPHARILNAGSATPERACAAVAIVKALASHARRVLEAPQKDSQLGLARYVLRRAIEVRDRMPPDKHTMRELLRATQDKSEIANAEDPADWLRGIVRRLERRHWMRLARTTPGSKGGRPSELFEISPYADTLTQPTEPGESTASDEDSSVPSVMSGDSLDAEFDDLPPL